MNEGAFVGKKRDSLDYGDYDYVAARLGGGAFFA